MQNAHEDSCAVGVHIASGVLPNLRVQMTQQFSSVVCLSFVGDTNNSRESHKIHSFPWSFVGGAIDSGPQHRQSTQPCKTCRPTFSVGRKQSPCSVTWATHLLFTRHYLHGQRMPRGLLEQSMGCASNEFHFWHNSWQRESDHCCLHILLSTATTL